ncbi:MAG TPA: PAS domain-containing protein, partial [Patescibacteria group bacterium]|nr:PAS domain-containing protein [Patescibacteria group bacterium]
MSLPIRLLMIEDSADDAELVVRELTRGGFSPDAFRVTDEKGLQAALADGTWDLILMDFVIPKFGGLQALEVIRDSGTETPVILVSGKVGDEVAVEVMRAGARDFVMKENLSRLAPVVRRELDAARARREGKKAQEALRRKEQLLAEALDRAPVILFSLDVRGVMSVCRGRGLEAIGLRAEEAVGKSVFEVFADIPEETAKLQRVFIGETIRTIAKVRGRALDTIASPIRNESGVITGVSGIAIDITERVSAEEELRETQRIFQRAQEVAHIGTWYSDPSQAGKLRWSDEVYRIFGIQRQAFDGRVETFFTFIHPRDADRVRAASTAALDDGKPYDLEHRIIRPDGRIRWVHEKADVIRDVSGKATQMVGVVQDITERKASERLLALQSAVATVLAGSPTRETLHARVIEAVCRGLGWQLGAAWQPRPGDNDLRCVEFWTEPGFPSGPFEKATRAAAFGRGVGLPGRAWRNMEAVWVADVTSADWYNRTAEAREAGLHAAAAFPLFVG